MLSQQVQHVCALQVEVTDVAAGRTWYFEADCWLDAAAAAKGAAGTAELLLTASSSNPLADRKTYQVGALQIEIAVADCQHPFCDCRSIHTLLRTGTANLHMLACQRAYFSSSRQSPLLALSTSRTPL
jgi:hypothetical protein